MVSVDSGGVLRLNRSDWFGGVMTRAASAFAGALLSGLAVLSGLAALAPVQAQTNLDPTTPFPTEPRFLTENDAAIYRAIFVAQENGELNGADTLATALDDKLLMGYVLHQRYLGRHYITRFDELSTWLTRYGDLAGADRIYNLALRKKPARARNPSRPVRAGWRGQRFDDEATLDAPMQSTRGETLLSQLRQNFRNGDAGAAERTITRLKAERDLPQADIGRLYSFVAAAYRADAQDADALRVAHAGLGQDSQSAALLHWSAGLASYRMGDFEAATRHFERMSERGADAPRDLATGAFWAARAAMHAGMPQRVIAHYERAASKPFTFYGMLAEYLLGRDHTISFVEPALDEAAFAQLKANGAAGRAIGLWQADYKEPIELELSRAFAETDPDLDPAFAALARALGVPSMELRAAETSAERNIFLTSLYPVPPYEPQGGYQFDQAMVLAVARQESRFDADAHSRSGARGLMQIMPSTAAYIASDPSLARAQSSQLDNPSYSMRLGEDYLLDLVDGQNGNLLSLAAAYNAGPGNLSRWLVAQEGNNDPLLFIESLPAPETRGYVKRVMINLWMYNRRFGEPAAGLDDTAAGNWPILPRHRVANFPIDPKAKLSASQIVR